MKEVGLLPDGKVLGNKEHNPKTETTPEKQNDFKDLVAESVDYLEGEIEILSEDE
jgi:hypothetical protein